MAKKLSTQTFDCNVMFLFIALLFKAIMLLAFVLLKCSENLIVNKNKLIFFICGIKHPTKVSNVKNN